MIRLSSIAGVICETSALVGKFDSSSTMPAIMIPSPAEHCCMKLDAAKNTPAVCWPVRTAWSSTTSASMEEELISEIAIIAP